MRQLILIFSCFLFSQQSTLADNNKDRITANISINVPLNRIHVKMDYEFYLEENTKELRFFLNKQVGEFKCVLSNPNSTYTFKEDSNSMLAGLVKDLVISFSETVKTDDKISINLDYIIDGIINNENWIELYVEKFWIPLESSFGRTFNYDYNIEITEGYNLITAGVQTELENGSFRVKSTSSMIDVPLIATKKVSKVDSKNDSVSIYFTNKLSYLSEVMSQSSFILNYFNRIFGELNNYQDLKIIFRPKDIILNPYARPGYLVMNQDDEYLKNKLHNFKLIAHETAHLWWSLANPMDFAWMNESMSEYSAILVIEEKFGSDERDKILKTYEEQTKDLGAVTSGNPLSDAFLLYRKGPVVLSKLEKMIGKNKMIDLLAIVFKYKITTTNQFLKLLKQKHGKDICEKFKLLLEN